MSLSSAPENDMRNGFRASLDFIIAG